MTTLESPKIDKLLTRLDELVKWRPGGKGKYEDLHSALSRIQGAANHVITGRRGSGKTRLIDELKRASSTTDTLVVSVGAEDYKELTYPDILIQVLRSFLREFRELLKKRPDLLSREWWTQKWVIMIHPIRTHNYTVRRKELLNDVTAILQTLDSLLTESDELTAEYAERQESSAAATESGKVHTKMTPLEVNVDVGKETRSSKLAERRAKQKELKRDKVEGKNRHKFNTASRYQFQSKTVFKPN